MYFMVMNKWVWQIPPDLLCLYLGYHINIFKTMKICILWRPRRSQWAQVCFIGPECFLLSSPYCTLISLSGTMPPGLSSCMFCAGLHIYTHMDTYTNIHIPLGRLHVPGPANQHFPDDISWVPISRAQNNLNPVQILDLSVIEVNIFSICKSVWTDLN